ncbi:hypothetical protein QUA56_32075, partial [Microcoleus sp. N3A4]|uniref:hypothetical protein n=1 Tax=Microcoleus sp. N3A4 TaxID=3055379 RepID=UPI002FD5BD8A
HLARSKGFLKRVQHLSYNSHLAPFSTTGILPVPQRGNFLLVERASCPFKRLLEKGATSQL